jgi:hypothetical protein
MRACVLIEDLDIDVFNYMCSLQILIPAWIPILIHISLLNSSVSPELAFLSCEP